MALSEQTFASVVFSGKLFDVQFSQEESSEGLERRGFIPHNASVADSTSLVAVVFSTKVQKRLQVTLRLSHFWLSCQTAVAKLGEWSKDANPILQGARVWSCFPSDSQRRDQQVTSSVTRARQVTRPRQVTRGQHVAFVMPQYMKVVHHGHPGDKEQNCLVKDMLECCCAAGAKKAQRACRGSP